MSSKIKLGLYMSAPIIGGAEQYFKDLLWNIDRSEYEVHLFYDSWPDFDEFLRVEKCVDIYIHPIKVIEPGKRFGSRQSQKVSKYNRNLIYACFTKLYSGLKFIRHNVPLFSSLGIILYTILKYLLMPINYWRLYQVFRRYSIDIIHINNGGYPGASSAQLAAIVAKRVNYGKVVMTVCNMPQPSDILAFFDKKLDCHVISAIDKVIVPSNFLGQALVEQRKFKANQLVKIPYGAFDVTDYFSINSPSNLSHNLIIGMVASFYPHKGYQHLVKSVSLLLETTKDFHVILVGDGPHRQNIEDLVSELQLEDYITFKGYCILEKTIQIMSGFDIFVLSSELEGMPYVITHAMNLALPVITTPVGGIPEQVQDEESAILISPGNIQGLKNALLRLLEKDELRVEMGQKGLSRYHQHFTLERMLVQHQQLYKTILVDR